MKTIQEFISLFLLFLDHHSNPIICTYKTTIWKVFALLVNVLDSDSYLFNVSFVQYKRGIFLMGKELSFTYVIFSLEN